MKVARPRQIRVSASDHREPIELPGGAYWWLGANKSSSTVIYGENFVWERPRVGGPGLIPVSKQNVSVQRFKSPRSGPPAVRPHQPTGMILSGMVVLDTEFDEVFDVDLLDPAVSNTAESFPSTTCTGIVYVGSGDNDTIDVQDVGAASSRHPRRTRRMRFTCNLCGEVNEKEVNPNAWRTGSVFARCEGCTAVHKLKDNLKVRRKEGNCGTWRRELCLLAV